MSTDERDERDERDAREGPGGGRRGAEPAATQGLAGAPKSGEALVVKPRGAARRFPLFLPPPRFHVTRLTDLDPATLADEFRAVLLDVDNTLVPHHGLGLDATVRGWIDDVLARGLRVALASNGSVPRIRRLTEIWGIDGFRAYKPMPRWIRRWVHGQGYHAREVLLVGDQVFTDHLAGVLSGVATALVDPVSDVDMLLTRHVTRRLERILRRRWARTVARVARDVGESDPLD